MAEKTEKDAEAKEKQAKISKKILIIAGNANLNKKLKTDNSLATQCLESFCVKNEPVPEEVEEVIYVQAESPDDEEMLDSSSLDDALKGKALQEYEDDVSDVEEKGSGKGSPSVDQDADGSNIWSNTSINLLLEEYKKRINHFRDRKIKKVPLWREIGAVFKKKNKSFGPMTIYTKFRNMKSTYRKIKLNELLRTSGAGCRWQWTKDMDEIFHDDESFNFSTDSIFSHKLHDHTQFIVLSSHHKSNEGQKQYAGQKRQDYLDWSEYFMATAFLAAKRSKDPTCQVGACIVNKDNVIVGIGYNGMPKDCHDDKFPWSKHSQDVLDNKYMYVCHAELNAILNKNSADVKDCTMYVGLFPCNECAKVIIQAGIKEIIYMSDKHAHKKSTIGSKRMLDAAGVMYKQFVPKHKMVSIDFSQIDWNDMNQLPSTPIKHCKKQNEEESDDQQ